MECSTWQEEFQIWLPEALEGGSQTAPPAELAEHARSCPACGPRLEAARLILEGSVEPTAPAGLADRIMTRVHERADERDRDRFGAGPPADGRTRRRAVRRPAWFVAIGAGAAAMVAVIFAAGMLVGRATNSDATASRAEAAEVIRVEFRLVAPDARGVAVVGDWNGWDADADRLADPDGDGVWEGTVVLRRAGEYEYQFLIDDERWMPDPESPLTVDDGYGGRNSILNI